MPATKSPAIESLIALVIARPGTRSINDPITILSVLFPIPKDVLKRAIKDAVAPPMAFIKNAFVSILLNAIERTSMTAPINNDTKKWDIALQDGIEFEEISDIWNMNLHTLIRV